LTTEPEVPPLSAEEIAEAHAVYAKQQAKGDYRGSFDSVRDMDLLDPGRLLATIAAKDAQSAELEAVRPTCICTDTGLCVYHNKKFIRPLEEQIDALQSQLRDANRRASELFDELGATQNVAQAERVELESKLRETEAVADGMQIYVAHLSAGSETDVDCWAPTHPCACGLDALLDRFAALQSAQDQRQ
jgi:multidrug efflux pump subunit AcrA (membrane-fusion protein)